jgi:uncharacterized cupredoxin-like copper-binding protein
MGRRKQARLLVAVLAIALVAAACSSDDSDTSGSTSPSEGETGSTASVNATVKDFAIALDATTAASGEVKFDITNDGPSEHEFVVLQTDLAPDALPVENGAANEEAEGIANAGEVEGLASGDTGTLTLTLDPGSYVIMCNLPGHYEKGMYTGFTVT